MAAELESLALSSSLPENIAIEEVLDSETLRAWCSVMTTVYEFPDFAADVWYKILDHLGLGTDRTLRHFLALADGVPVATASLFLGGGVAGLSSIATLPDHRHQGIATAITGETYDVARRSGYHIGTLFSAPEAVGIYEKIGFRKLSTGNCYVWGVDEELPPM